MDTACQHYEKAPFTVDVIVRHPAGGSHCRGRSIDLSAVGMGLYCERFFLPGEHLRLGLRLQTGDSLAKQQSFVVDAVVRWAQSQESGSILSVEFDRPLSATREPALYGALAKKEDQ